MRKAIRAWLPWVGINLILWGSNFLPGHQLVRDGLERALLVGASLGRAVGQAVGFPARMVDYWYRGSRRLVDLEDRLMEVTADRVECEATRLENERLNQLLGLPSRPVLTTVTTGWLVPVGRQFILPKGDRMGIKAGMIVIDQAGVLVGLVEEVSAYSARVATPTRAGREIAVLVNPSKLTGVVRGDGTVAMLTEVAATMALNVGDVVITAGTDGQLPFGLVVGEVEKVVSVAAEVNQTAMLKLAGKPDSILVVE